MQGKFLHSEEKTSMRGITSVRGKIISLLVKINSMRGK
jgi:hypothetical protein